MPAAMTRARDGFELAGDLTVGSAPALFAQTRFDFDAGAALRIDLRAVGEVDSGGLALLLYWQAAAARTNTRLRFTGAPAQLREMAKISGVAGLLNLAADDAP